MRDDYLKNEQNMFELIKVLGKMLQYFKIMF